MKPIRFSRHILIQELPLLYQAEAMHSATLRERTWVLEDICTWMEIHERH